MSSHFPSGAKRGLVAILIATLVSAFVAGPGRAQVVLSEDFETPNTTNFVTFDAGQVLVTATNSWTVTVSGIDLFRDAARPEAVAFDGGQAVDLTGSPGAGVMATTFATLPGAQYRLVFHYARNNLLGVATGDAQVEVLGAAPLLLASVHHVPANHPFNQYLQFDDTFTADSVQSTLRFSSLDAGNAGITIDGISIEQLAAPLPVLDRLGSLVLISALLTVFVSVRPRAIQYLRLPE